jgi:TonB family protein
MRRLGWIAAVASLIWASACARHTAPTTTMPQVDSAPVSVGQMNQPDKHVSDQPPPCPTKFDDGIETNDIAGKSGPGITYPKTTYSAEAEFSETARMQLKKNGHFQASSILKVVVGVDGRPHEICLVRSAGFGLDSHALKAVRQYQFEPATKDGKPIPFRVSIEVIFRGY